MVIYTNKKMTLKNILHDAVEVLEKNKIDDAEYDATEILLSLVDMDMARFLFEYEDEMEEKYDRRYISNLISDYNELINARSSHFPLQYILGETYFCGLKFDIDRNVLIPRADTETLVEKVLIDNADKNKSVLDLCTGSGCIAISLANLGNYKCIVGTDISDEALEVARSNAENILNNSDSDDEMSQHIYFLKSDMFAKMYKIKDSLGIEKFDIITANPPYIRTADINNLQIEVKQYEPIEALDGDKDGLKFYREIAKEGKKFLSDDGKIYLEIGYDQAIDVKEIFEKENYSYIDTIKDLGGNDRVMIFGI